MASTDITAEDLLTELLRRLPGVDEVAALKELGWGLVIEAQLLLEQISTPDEIEFFSQVFVEERDARPRVWVDAILVGIANARIISTAQFMQIKTKGVARAVGQLRTAAS